MLACPGVLILSCFSIANSMLQCAAVTSAVHTVNPFSIHGRKRDNMPHLKRTFLALVAFAALGFAATPARADIVFLGQLSQQGQGIGAVNTALTLINNTGAVATGSITPAGPTGNRGPGAAPGGF